METLVENKSKRIAFTFTIGIHMLLFLFFLFTGFINPQPENSVVADNKGESGLDGYDFVELDAAIPSSDLQSSTKLISDPNETDVHLEKMTVATKSLNTDVHTDLEYETILKKWNGRKKSNGQNENSVGSDLLNMKNGVIEGKSIPNDIIGTFILPKRSLIKKPEVILNSADEGKVVVDIIVNESGKVISAVAGQRGSTTTSAMLYKRAIDAAYTAKFNPSEDGAKEQRGTYTFVFTLE